jgi:CRISPR-associated protein Cmr1
VIPEQTPYKFFEIWPVDARNHLLSKYIGIGLWKTGSNEQRQSIRENQHFTIELVLKPTATAADAVALRDTLKLWGWLGGLGSRSRRGFGSIALESLDGSDALFEDTDAYLNAIKTLLNSYSVSTVKPPYTAFSNLTKIGVTSETSSFPYQVHQDMGVLFNNYRGQPSELRGPKKRVFGMPYMDKNEANSISKEANARRASPLLFHIHPVGNQYQGLVLCLPAVFHPDTDLNNVDDDLLFGFIEKLQEVPLWK